LKPGVGVEKETKAVISMDFSVSREPTFNNLRTDFFVEIPLERVFQQPQAISRIIKGRPFDVGFECGSELYRKEHPHGL